MCEKRRGRAASAATAVLLPLAAEIWLKQRAFDLAFGKVNSLAGIRRRPRHLDRGGVFLSPCGRSGVAVLRPAAVVAVLSLAAEIWLGQRAFGLAFGSMGSLAGIRRRSRHLDRGGVFLSPCARSGVAVLCPAAVVAVLPLAARISLGHLAFDLAFKHMGI